MAIRAEQFDMTRPEGAPFWDSSGDDFMTPELALKAVLRAPGPPTSWH